MNYYSLNNKNTQVSFKEAVIQGLAQDKGLYFPSKIKPLEKSFFDTIENLSNAEIAFQVIKPFVGDSIPEEKLKEIVRETLSFDFPVVFCTKTAIP